jgi:hypothetical protein
MRPVRRLVALLAVVLAAVVVVRRVAADRLDADDVLAAPRDLTGSPLARPEGPGRLGTVGGNPQVLGPAWEPGSLAALAGWVPGAPGSAFVRAAAYAWAAPLTLAGLVLGAASGARPVVRDGVLLFPGARGPVGALLRVQGYAATTLGHAVIATRDPDPALMAHELVHVRQAERLGVFFAPVYGLLWLVYGYGRHPLERAARRGARERRAPQAA